MKLLFAFILIALALGAFWGYVFSSAIIGLFVFILTLFGLGFNRGAGAR